MPTVTTKRRLSAHVDAITMPLDKLRAQAMKAQQEIEKRANRSKQDREWYFDALIDTTCRTYKGFKVGEVIYQKSMFNSTEFDEQLVLGFTAPLLVNNPFANKEARAGKFRRIIVAGTYKGKLSGPYSQPPDSFTKKPVAITHACPYCRRQTTVLNNQGACDRIACKYKALVNSL